MTANVDEIDWGDCPDWRDQLAAAAWARTEAEYGQRPDNEETT